MRILVVDDSNPHRRLLTALFTRAGHEVMTAPDGVAALALLETSAVDAVVFDVRMPRMDGFQLCRSIRQDPRWTRLPFIFYSSVFIDDPAQALGRDLGARAMLRRRRAHNVETVLRSLRPDAPAESAGRARRINGRDLAGIDTGRAVK